MFHVTSVENAQKLLADGVDMELAGTTGGLQAGWGANQLLKTCPFLPKCRYLAHET